MSKKIFKVLDKNGKTVGVFLSVSKEALQKYIEQNALLENIYNYTISQLSEEEQIEGDTSPIMMANRKLWYDLRHEKYILIFDEESH